MNFNILMFLKPFNEDYVMGAGHRRKKINLLPLLIIT